MSCCILIELDTGRALEATLELEILMSNLNSSQTLAPLAMIADSVKHVLLPDGEEPSYSKGRIKSLPKTFIRVRLKRKLLI